MRTLLIFAATLLLGVLTFTAVAQAQSKEAITQEYGDKAQPFKRSGVAQLADSVQSLKNAKSIHVKSTSLLVGTSVIEDKLQKRKEFQQLGLIITRDENDADLILEVEHDVFTMYTYTVMDSRSRVLVASGKLSSLGGTVAGKVAKRFMKQMLQARQS